MNGLIVAELILLVGLVFTMTQVFDSWTDFCDFVAGLEVGKIFGQRGIFRNKTGTLFLRSVDNTSYYRDEFLDNKIMYTFFGKEGDQNPDDSINRNIKTGNRAYLYRVQRKKKHTWYGEVRFGEIETLTHPDINGDSRTIYRVECFPIKRDVSTKSVDYTVKTQKGIPVEVQCGEPVELVLNAHQSETNSASLHQVIGITEVLREPFHMKRAEHSGSLKPLSVTRIALDPVLTKRERIMAAIRERVELGQPFDDLYDQI